MQRDAGHHEVEREHVSASKRGLSCLKKGPSPVGESNREEVVHAASTQLAITQIEHKTLPKIEGKK